MVHWNSVSVDTFLNDRMTVWIQEMAKGNLSVDIVNTSITSCSIGSSQAFFVLVVTYKLYPIPQS
jgi:hypothetical protein